MNELTTRDKVKELASSTEVIQSVTFMVGCLWIVLDFISYTFISRNLGLSRSYGLFFNIWILGELLSWSVRISVSLKVYIGLAVFLIGIVVHFFIVRFF